MNPFFPLLRLGFRPFGALVLLAAVLTAATSSPAATITWGPAQNISGDSDVSTAGSLVGAFNLGTAGVPNTTINGVPFSGLAVSGVSTTSGSFNFASAINISGNNNVYLPGPFGLSPAYVSLLSSNISAFGLPIILTVSGLDSGSTYLFEWWSSNNYGSPNITTASAGNSIALLSTTGEYGPALFRPGQFALGTFVADATTQTIVFSNAAFTQINGFQLRQVANVPETGSTIVLLGLGLLSVIVFGRKVAARIDGT